MHPVAGLRLADSTASKLAAHASSGQRRQCHSFSSVGGYSQLGPIVGEVYGHK